MIKAIDNSPKEAKIVKLNRIPSQVQQLQKSVQLQQYQSKQPKQLTNFEISKSSYDNESFSETSDTETLDVSGEFLEKLFVIKDYWGSLVYGDLRVERGEFVYPIFESDVYYLVENELGAQGFVPKECCVNLDETVQKARSRMIDGSFSKITSL